MLQKNLSKFLVALGFGAFALSASAAPCSVGNYFGGATAADLNTTNITINAAGATDCYGHVSIAGNSLASVVTAANGSSLFGGSWDGILRADSSTASGDYSGLNFSITGLDFNTTDMLFTLKITDLDPLTAPSIPLTMDLLLTLKAGTSTDFYFFDDVNLSASNNGSYQMAIRNPQGNNFQGLSDISVMGRDIVSNGCSANDPRCTPNRVPEPAPLGLVAVALGALGFAARRRRV